MGTTASGTSCLLSRQFAKAVPLLCKNGVKLKWESIAYMHSTVYFCVNTCKDTHTHISFCPAAYDIHGTIFFEPFSSKSIHAAFETYAFIIFFDAPRRSEDTCDLLVQLQWQHMLWLRGCATKILKQPNGNVTKRML